MLALPVDFAAALSGRVLGLTVAWRVTRLDGEILRGTAHQEAITIDSGEFAGTYPPRASIYASDIASKSDGSVSNADVESAFFSDVNEITVEDIEGGLYDQAPATLFLLDWRRPNAGQKVLLDGTLGEFTRDSEGRWRSEVRGLTQALAQQIVKSYSERCDVKLFGDVRCKFAVADVTRSGVVSEVLTRRLFRVELDEGASPIGPASTYYAGGRLEVMSGDLAGIVREVRTVQFEDTGETELTVLLWDELPGDIEVGTMISLPPGCDRSYDTCRLIHQNLVNFRGHGIFAVGRDRLLAGVSGDTAPIVMKTEEELLAEKESQDAINRQIIEQAIDAAS